MWVQAIVQVYWKHQHDCLHSPLSPLWITIIVTVQLHSDMFSHINLFEFHIAGFNKLAAFSIIEQVHLLFLGKPDMHTLNSAFTKFGLVDFWCVCIGFTAK